MNLRRAPVRAAGDEVTATRVVRPRAYRGRAGRIEVRDLFGSNRIADVHNSWHRKHRQVGGASRLPPRQEYAAATAFVDVDDVGLAFYSYWNRMLRDAAVQEQKLADHSNLRARLARLDVAGVQDYESVGGGDRYTRQVQARGYNISAVAVLADGEPVARQAERLHVEGGDHLRLGRVGHVDRVVAAVPGVADVVGQTVGREAAFVADRRDRRDEAAVGTCSNRRVRKQLRETAIVRKIIDVDFRPTTPVLTVVRCQ